MEQARAGKNNLYLQFPCLGPPPDTAGLLPHHRESDSLAQILTRNLHSNPFRTGTDSQNSYFAFKLLPNAVALTGKNTRE